MAKCGSNVGNHGCVLYCWPCPSLSHTPTVFPWPVAVLSSSLFFSGAWSCYRQDKAGLPELGLSIIPLPSSEKKKKKNSAEAHQHTAEEERRK